VVVVVRATLVALLVTFPVASGMVAPLWSITSPVICPPVWGSSAPVAITSNPATEFSLRLDEFLIQREEARNLSQMAVGRQG